MKAKRLLSLLLTAALMLSMVTPVLAASAETELPRASQTRLEETNEVVSIRLQASGKLVYGSPFELSVVTRPADAQYIGVVLGIKGEAKGYVTLVLSDKLRTLLKMIPLPRKMSKTPDQVEEFNVYAYIKQLIDGNDVSVLLGVADEVVKVMDTLKFYIPTLKDMSMGLKLSLELIRRYLPEGAFSRIYLDEQPVDSGRYIAENTDYTGILKLVYDKDNNVLIGASVVGNYASEYIVAVSNLIDMKVDIDRAKKLVFPHPTVCEVVREGLFEIK